MLDIGEVIDPQRVSRRKSRGGGQLRRRQVARQQRGSVRNIIAIDRGITHGTDRSPTTSACAGAIALWSILWGTAHRRHRRGTDARHTETNAFVLSEGVCERRPHGRPALRSGLAGGNDAAERVDAAVQHASRAGESFGPKNLQRPSCDDRTGCPWRDGIVGPLN